MLEGNVAYVPLIVLEILLYEEVLILVFDLQVYVTNLHSFVVAVVIHL